METRGWGDRTEYEIEVLCLRARDTANARHLSKSDLFTTCAQDRRFISAHAAAIDDLRAVLLGPEPR